MAKLADLVRAFVTQKGPVPTAEPELAAGAHGSGQGGPTSRNGAVAIGQAGSSAASTGNAPVPTAPSVIPGLHNIVINFKEYIFMN